MEESPGISAEWFLEEQHGVLGPGLDGRVEAAQQRLDPRLPLRRQRHPQQMVEDARQRAEGILTHFVPIHGGQKVQSLVQLAMLQVLLDNLLVAHSEGGGEVVGRKGEGGGEKGGKC